MKPNANIDTEKMVNFLDFITDYLSYDLFNMLLRKSRLAVSFFG